MTADECARIVNLVVSTWPAGPKGHAWTEAIRDLAYADARAAYESVRDVEDRPPSIARYLAAYRAVRARVAAETPPMTCELCDGTGFVEADLHPGAPCPFPRADGSCICHAVAPCRCSTGRARVDVARRIVEANDRDRVTAGRRP